MPRPALDQAREAAAAALATEAAGDLPPVISPDDLGAVDAYWRGYLREALRRVVDLTT
jgi:hypothetical protein